MSTQHIQHIAAALVADGIAPASALRFAHFYMSVPHEMRQMFTKALKEGDDATAMFILRAYS